MLRSYRYRLYPTPEQKVLLSKHFGCARWVYNWALAEKTARYVEAGVGISIYELQPHLPELKAREETAWLGEVSAASLQSALRNLDDAFTRFFKRTGAYPRFKSKHRSRQSFQVPTNTHIHFDTQRIRLLKFQEGIKGCFNRTFEGKVKTTTVFLTPTGKYYASIQVDDGVEEPTPPSALESDALGLDFGLKDLVITSEGQRFANPKALKRYLRRLQIRQRRLSRKVKGSKNRDKARQRLALTHERISNIRNDNLHKVSSNLVRENQATTLCIEDLSVTAMLTSGKRSRSLNRSIGDAGWRELRRQIEYKAKWYGKNVRVIGRWEASSKTCSCCGHIYRSLVLSERQWTCAQCGTTHDRDVNAARNIRAMAFREQNTSSEALVSKVNYRQACRKATPVEEPTVAPAKREHDQRHDARQSHGIAC